MSLYWMMLKKKFIRETCLEEIENVEDSTDACMDCYVYNYFFALKLIMLKYTNFAFSKSKT